MSLCLHLEPYGHEHAPHNKTLAVQWFKLAHEQGHHRASFMLAHTHVTHDGEHKDHTGLRGEREKIMNIFKEAGANGVNEARHMYVKCLNGDHDCI